MNNQINEDFNQRITNQPFEGPSKKCVHCRLDIPKSANVCPYCQKKQVTVGAIIVIIVLFIFIYSFFNKDDEKDLKVGNVDTETSSTSDIAISETNEPEAVMEEIVKLPTVGEYVAGDTWKISLLEAKEYASIESEYYTETPVDGKEYLVLFFDVENISNEDDYFNYFYIESYLDSYSIDLTVLMNEVDGNKNLTGDVAKGKKLKGCLTYEVDMDWKELEVSYKKSIFGSAKESTFLITPDNLTK